MESPEGLRAASSLASTAPAVSSKVNTRVLGTGRRATFARDLFMASPILRAAGLAGQAACSETCRGMHPGRHGGAGQGDDRSERQRHAALPGDVVLRLVEAVSVELVDIGRASCRERA